MFFQKCFCKLNISKIVRLVLAALSVNGLNINQCVEEKCHLSSVLTYIGHVISRIKREIRVYLI